MEKTTRILIVSGEASGDMHAASLVQEIKNIRPGIEFFGLGGSRLKKTGVDIYYDIVSLAVVGLFEVLKNLGKFKQIFRRLLVEVDRRNPNLAILVDYPGFNLRLAKELKKRNIPIIYYISPQVWAWGGDRIQVMKQLIDLVIVFFQFEEAMYSRQAIPVAWVGHPLVDQVKIILPREIFLSQLGLDIKKTTFALLPGSREKEVKLLLPIMLKSATILSRQLPQAQFLILRSSAVKQKVFDRIKGRYSLPLAIATDMTYEGIAACDFALVASGTATLETAILQKPMVILYKVSFLTWVYMKMAIQIPYIGLVNIVKGEKFIPEFVQYEANPLNIARYILKMVQDPQRLKRIRAGLTEVSARLGEKGASKKAAQLVIDHIDTRWN